MLAYYVQWHMKEKLAPLMFAEENPEQAKAQRKSVVAPAKPSADTLEKTRTKKNGEGDRITSFQSLMDHLALLGKFKLVPEDPSEEITYKVLETLSPEAEKSIPTAWRQTPLDCLVPRYQRRISHRKAPSSKGAVYPADDESTIKFSHEGAEQEAGSA